MPKKPGFWWLIVAVIGFAFSVGCPSCNMSGQGRDAPLPRPAPAQPQPGTP